MFRIIFLLSSWFTLGWGCLSCSYGDIKVLTHLYLHVEKNVLQSVDIEWTLDPMFSQMVLGDFDLNRNGKFENSERYEVYKAIAGMKEMGFFIRPSINNRPIRLKELKNFTVRQDKGLVIYRFSILINTPIKEALHLRVAYDANSAFDNGIIYHLNAKNVYLLPKHSARLTTKLTVPKISRGSDSVLDIHLFPQSLAIASPFGTDSGKGSHDGGFTQSLRTLTEKIHGALVEAQEHPSIASIGAILLFSLLYGILHAAGPGHGKTLVASYFGANERSYTRAVSVALLIAATHVISALAVSAVLYGFIHTMFSQTMQDVALYTTRISGVIILIITLYLIRQKWLYYRPNSKAMSFSATAPHLSSCGCHSCKSSSDTTDLGLVLGAGIVPCPATIIVFLFAFSMGMFWLGALSALVMSLGMGLTIALIAVAGTALRKKSSSYGDKTLRFVDIGSVIIMFGAGVFLVMAA
jgi:nickel/cobalt transporter (NicO) family protein